MLNENNRIADELLDGVNGGRELTPTKNNTNAKNVRTGNEKARLINPHQPQQQNNVFMHVCAQCGGQMVQFKTVSGDRAVDEKGHFINI
jgi:hypothetical protein